jgi:hypothetical protein
MFHTFFTLKLLFLLEHGSEAETCTRAILEELYMLEQMGKCDIADISGVPRDEKIRL